jgi:hypothetical protein
MSWKRFFQRRTRREESAIELEAYLQKETEDNMERGMSADGARRVARLKLGNVTNILSEMAAQDSFGSLETLLQDVRYGMRMLAKHRGFALVSLLTLALGIGANTAIFTVVDATLLRPLPFPNANRVVMVWERRMPDGEHQYGEEFSDGKRRNKRDSHREFHRHAALNDVLQCFLEDGIAADQSYGQSDHADSMKRLPQVKPDGRCSDRDEDDSQKIDDLESMVMIVMFVIFRQIMRGQILWLGKMDSGFGDLYEICACAFFVRDRHDRLRPC